MKYIIAILLCICFTQSMNSTDHNDEVKQYIEFNRFVDGRKYICYEFGISEIISIYIADGDTICDVIICDGNSQCISMTCKRAPILQWAFDKMEIELNGNQYVIDNNYKPYYYKLSLIEDRCQTIIASTTLRIINNDKMATKLEELRTFMADLWSSVFIK